MIGQLWTTRSAMLGLLLSLQVASNVAHGESSYFTVQVKSIEAMVVDRSKGTLSANIVGADRKAFVSSGSNHQRARADDVFLRVNFVAQGDGNLQPPITIVVLENVNSVDGPALQVINWQTVNDYPDSPGIFDENGQGAATALLKEVTCSNLEIVVKVGTDNEWGQSATALLPFECKK